MLTVADILDLPVVRRGRPEVLGGGADLGRTVRWVHVSEQLDHAGLLDGGELVLATGLTLETRPDGATRLVQDLQDAGAAGLVVELLPGRDLAERRLRAAATGAAIPVVVLRRRVRFVEVTQVVHSALVAEQLARVQAQQEAHELFTGLSLRAADPPEVVSAAARSLGLPVVLEDLAGRVLVVDPWGRPLPEVLDERSSTSWLAVTVGTGDRPWGRLLAATGPGGSADGEGAEGLGGDGVAGVAGAAGVTGGGSGARVDAALTAMILERAAQTLAINEMTRRDRGVLARQARASCLEEVRSGQLTGHAAESRAAALGLDTTGAFLPAAVRVDDRGATTPEEMQRRTGAVRDALESAAEDLGLGVLASPARHDLLSVVVALGAPGAHGSAEEVAARLAAGLRARASGPAAGVVAGVVAGTADAAGGAGAEGRGEVGVRPWWLGVGDVCPDLLTCVGSLGPTEHLADSAASIPDLPDLPFYRAEDVRVRGVLAGLVDDPSAEAFVAAELGALRDPERAEDLRLLEQYLELGGRKTELARRTFLSRPTLYARLARLADELGTTLESGESRTSLHVAVLLLRQSQARARAAGR